MTTSLFSPAQEINLNTTSTTHLHLNKEQITSIVEQKLNLLDINKYSLETIIAYYDQIDHRSLFYVVTLKPTGFMIITSNYMLPPIIGYSFTSSFNQNSDEHDMFIEFITTDLKQRIHSSEKTIHKREWNKVLSNSLSVHSTTVSEQWPPKGYSSTEGWIETQWHQDSPYNDLCPIDLESNTRGVAGCPAVAIAQILNYHQTINGVFFNDTDDYTHNYGQRFRIDDDYQEYGFPSFPELNTYLETIQTHFNQNILLTDVDKAALIFACGTAATQVYSPQGSGTFGVSQAHEAYQKFNCEQIELLTSEDEEIYDYIIQNVKIGLPVHLAIVNEAWNAGHNLIIDGYNTDDCYHLNFGWGGSFDGWYDLPDELPYELTFIEGVIVDILVPMDAADLTTSGSIQLTDITPGSPVNGSFIIQNKGDSDSLLDWKIESYPDWGIWEFSEEQGNDLTPDQGENEITVNIEIPSEKSKTFTGGIKIINTNSPNDFEVIPISIATPQTKQISYLPNWMNKFLEHCPFFYQIINKIVNQ
ncbi:MAG: C10 family peptidase [Candidatus Thermoplasmatota archaeon]|nr:C10 family peptidase [Candidatus Thermoplasmatota archaeon]